MKKFLISEEEKNRILNLHENMKTVDKEGKQKMRPITILADEETLMPYWLTDKQDVILKVKEKA
jgi:hypothetical protein